MQQKSFLSLGPHGFHRIAYTEWGFSELGQTAVCVHGLTRNSRDFDYFAKEMSKTHHIFCPDIAGRGLSDWLVNPNDYGFPTYVNDMAALLAKIGDEKVDWIGTSMGGIIGMLLAASVNSPIQRLVINDVGPFVPKESLSRIGEYLTMNPKFANTKDVENHLRQIHATFGNLTDEQWQHLTTHSILKCDDGKFALHYDPEIGRPFKDSAPVDVDLWPVWEAIKCPVLILRGENSDLLTAETAQEMLTRGPDAELVEIPNTGHAPALMERDQINLVKQWLNG